MKRQTLLVGGLLATLGCSAWLALQRQDDAVPTVAAVVRPAALAPRRTAQAPARPVPARLAADWGLPPPGALAAWAAPAAPSPPAASAADRPAPPRFPYTWIGQVDDGGGVQALLNGPLRSFGARAGDVLDGRWRVERIAATRLQLTWLPTGEAVTVDTR